jgi:hypothetical protein
LKRHFEVLKEHAFMPGELASSSGSEALADRFVRLACLNYDDDDVKFREEARRLLAAHPSLAGETVCTAATVGNVQALQPMPQANPSLARHRCGPYPWEPLLYVAFSRLNSEAVGHSTLEAARILLQHGADPNAGYLWDGRYLFTALTGAFGEGERGPMHQPEHQSALRSPAFFWKEGRTPTTARPYITACSPGESAIWNCFFEFGLGKGGHGVWFKRLGSQLETPAELLQHQMEWAAKYQHLERLRMLLNTASTSMSRPVAFVIRLTSWQCSMTTRRSRNFSWRTELANQCSAKATPLPPPVFRQIGNAHTRCWPRIQP